MKLLVLCPRFPYPLEKGDKLRMYHQLRYLSKKHKIFLVALTDEVISDEAMEKVKEVVHDIRVFTFTAHKRKVALLRSVFSTTPFQVSYYYSPSIAAKIKEIAKSFEPDHVYCQLARMAEYAKTLPYPKTLDYMDAFGIGMDRRAEVVSGPISLIYRMEANRMKKYEYRIYHAFDHHTVISKQDAKHIKTPPGGKIEVVPNGIDTTFFQPIESKPSYDIGFVGNMGYPPNIDAAEYLINEIKGRLHPKHTFLIAGARPDKRVKLLAGSHVTVTGWIDDVRSAYNQCKLFVAPLWSGTGQQNKILEAMAMGVPCITTTPVNNAIGAEPGKEILVADTADEFKKCIEKLLSDDTLYHRIKENALIFVRQNYSWDKSVTLLSSLFGENP